VHAQTCAGLFLSGSGRFRFAGFRRDSVWEIDGRLLTLNERFGAHLEKKLFQIKAG
jgi:hypothetical protein